MYSRRFPIYSQTRIVIAYSLKRKSACQHNSSFESKLFRFICSFESTTITQKKRIVIRDNESASQSPKRHTDKRRNVFNVLINIEVTVWGLNVRLPSEVDG